MKPRDIFDLLAVAALFAAAFLFMRVAAPAFGAVPLIEVRLAAGAAILVPLVLLRGRFAEALQHWRAIVAMSLLHYVLPFTLFAWSLLTLTSGFTAIINASTPLFAAVVAWLWLGDRLPVLRGIGLLVGLAGVALLLRDKLSFDFDNAGLASLAAVAASCCYGIAAVMTKRYLSGVSPLVVSAGSLLAGALILLPFAIATWPEAAPTGNAWLMALLLGTVSTAIAFVLYFRLLASVGPTRAATVTFLVPVFAVVLGGMLLGEAITMPMIVGGAVILLGTGLSTGLIGPAARST